MLLTLFCFTEYLAYLLILKRVLSSVHMQHWCRLLKKVSVQCECHLSLTIDNVPVFVDLFYNFFFLDRCQSSEQIATAHRLVWW